MPDPKVQSQGPAGDLEFFTVRAHVAPGSTPEVDFLKMTKVVQLTLRAPGAVTMVLQWAHRGHCEDWAYELWRLAIAQDGSVDALLGRISACKTELAALEAELRRKGVELGR